MASVKWTAADLPDQSGRTIVVTGASSGIGLAAARELARAGARVVLAVRDPEKGQRVAAGIPGDTEVRPLDLASLASVRAFAAGWTGALDILVNNAGPARSTARPADPATRTCPGTGRYPAAPRTPAASAGHADARPDHDQRRRGRRTAPALPATARPRTARTRQPAHLSGTRPPHPDHRPVTARAIANSCAILPGTPIPRGASQDRCPARQRTPYFT